jgi:L-asparaginase type II
MRRTLLAAALCALAPAAGAQEPAPRPQVHLVATGGTIASTNYYAGTPGKVGVEALLRAVPALDTVAAVSAQQFANVASSAITPTMWLALARGIADTLRARPALAGVVVTHGTDTMEETAYFLDLTVADARPVIVTGAMRPADGVGIDGPANLLHAVRVAAHPGARGRGTMLVMNDAILAARDATKANTVRPDAFEAPVRGALGVADPERVVWHRPAARAPGFDLAGVRELPRVDVVYSHVGADGAAVDALVAAGARGLVIAATGRGSIPPLQRAAVDRAVARGVVVVVGSRTGAGSVPVGEGGAPDAPRTAGAGDLGVPRARVLLMLALTRTQDPRAVARIFAEHQ